MSQVQLDLASQLSDEASASPGLRELNVEARRQRILEAARQLIASGGMTAFSMRKLAAQAELSVNTLYNLFGARKDILSALAMDAIDRMDQVLDGEAPLDDPIERCRAIVSVCAGYMVDNEAFFRPVLVASLQAQLAGGARGNDVARRAAKMQALALRVAVERGLLADCLDPDQLGEQIYHGFEYASLLWALGQIDASTFEARALYGVEVVLLGLAKGKLRGQVESELRELEQRLASHASDSTR